MILWMNPVDYKIKMNKIKLFYKQAEITQIIF